MKEKPSSKKNKKKKCELAKRASEKPIDVNQNGKKKNLKQKILNRPLRICTIKNMLIKECSIHLLVILYSSI